MRCPVGQMAEIALPHAASFLRDQYGQTQYRADQQPARHGLIESQDAPHERAHARPVGLQHVVGLGIHTWNGEMDVPMMRGMALSIERVWKPEADRREYHGETQPGRHASKRMNRLMLQREVPGEEIGAHGHDDPPGQQGVEPNQQHPRPVQHQRYDPGGPIVAAECLHQRAHDR